METLVDAYRKILLVPKDDLQPYRLLGRDTADALTALVVCAGRHNAVSMPWYQDLSDAGDNKYSAVLSRTADVFGSLECQCYPGESIEKVTLLGGISVPKDKRLRKKYFEQSLSDEEKNWIFDEKKVETYYLPLSTVYEEPFSFFGKNLVVFQHPYCPLRIEVTFSRKVNTGKQMPFLKYEAFFLDRPLRRRLLARNTTLPLEVQYLDSL